MILVLEDDKNWQDYYRSLLRGREVHFFADGVAAMDDVDDKDLNLIILDVMLIGPTGFAVLNELQSYSNLARVPVVIVSNVELPSEAQLSDYGVAKVLDKATMVPRDILEVAERYDGPIKK